MVNFFIQLIKVILQYKCFKEAFFFEENLSQSIIIHTAAYLNYSNFIKSMKNITLI